jgi:hypothetical protein
MGVISVCDSEGVESAAVVSVSALAVASTDSPARCPPCLFAFFRGENCRRRALRSLRRAFSSHGCSQLEAPAKEQTLRRVKVRRWLRVTASWD